MNELEYKIIEFINNKTILILGFGIEGKSTYKFIRKHIPNCKISIFDSREIADNEIVTDINAEIICAENPKEFLNKFDIIFKSPGFPNDGLKTFFEQEKLTSQTDLFLRYASLQTIGITGTKGKSTTSSLIYHILKYAGKDCILVGNIGVPFFDFIDKVTPKTTVVAELSAHQVEFLHKSPHFGLLLNIFPEHLDYYKTTENYTDTKFNIAKFQNSDDIFIYNFENLNHLFKKEYNIKSIQHLITKNGLNTDNQTVIKNKKLEILTKNTQKSNFLFDLPLPLLGEHNFVNIAFAASVCSYLDIQNQTIKEAIYSFKSLPHRLEFIGEICGINWYNDSISTIPEAAIEAILAIENVDTIILGGCDKRKLCYQKLYDFLASSDIKNIIFIGEAGKRMFEEIDIKTINKLYIPDFKDVAKKAMEITSKGKACVLSPAASSYDVFKNFEERGKRFKELVLELA